MYGRIPHVFASKIIIKMNEIVLRGQMRKTDKALRSVFTGNALPGTERLYHT